MNWVIYWFRLWLNYRLKATKPLSKLILDNSTYRKISWNQEAVRLVETLHYLEIWHVWRMGAQRHRLSYSNIEEELDFFLNINITALKFHEVFLFYHLGSAHRICMGQRNVTKFLLQYALSPKSFGALKCCTQPRGSNIYFEFLSPDLNILFAVPISISIFVKNKMHLVIWTTIKGLAMYEKIHGHTTIAIHWI